MAEVCSRWRKIALSTPQLWAVITIYNPLPTKALIDLLPVHLERSREALLDVEVDTQGFAGPNADASQRLLGILEPHSYRIRRLKLHYLDGNVWERFRLDRAETTRNLECLEFRAWGSNHLLDNIRKSSFPRLTSLAILDIHSIIAKAHFPWHQLLTLYYDIHSIQAATFSDVLQECNRLTSLTICVRSRVGESDIPSRLRSGIMVQLDSLTSLTLRVAKGPGRTRGVMEVLSILSSGASLTSLSIEGIFSLAEFQQADEAEGEFLDALMEFLRRSKRIESITRLKVNDILADSDVIGLLLSLPALRSFEFSELKLAPASSQQGLSKLDRQSLVLTWMGECFSQGERAEEGVTAILSRLEELFIAVSKSWYEADKLLAGFTSIVHSRPCLHSAVVMVPGPMLPDAIANEAREHLDRLEMLQATRSTAIKVLRDSEILLGMGRLA
ncbi:hypothetical protein V5O48_010892 [Marasmius crinis-equi]|uniref:F-box domain-containing protein n=1 Tax=Marasmius crinis-equi TaxID=585013 RepID=A0ABR3F744_9AGAR